ncbi:MAG: DUF1902 domain-containing protein [Selenomonadaceae bacterium]|nr:DUF1902 domain-containing protein [Selenomonadaceae bacterium]
MEAEYKVEIEYDSEAGVWIATGDNVIVLILESESLDKLMEKVLNAVPELVELNNLQKYRLINFSMKRLQTVDYF